jgi:zinc transporter ZupT
MPMHAPSRWCRQPVPSHRPPAPVSTRAASRRPRKTLHSTIRRPYEDELAPQPKQRTAVRVAALVGPALLLLGLLAHTVLEGLAIGLQVRTL